MNAKKLPLKDQREVYEAYKLHLDMMDVRDLLAELCDNDDLYLRQEFPEAFCDDMYYNADFVREVALAYDDAYTWLEPAYDQMDDVLTQKLREALPAWKEAHPA